MNEYLSSASLKSMAKGQMLGKYGTLVGAYAIHLGCILFADFSAAMLTDTTTVPGAVIYYVVALIVSLLGGVFLYGEAYIYLKLACHQKVSINDLFAGFSTHSNKILQVQLVLAGVALICGLPNLLNSRVMAEPDNPYLLLIYVVLTIIMSIINIMVSLTFSQSFFLMLDFPQYSAKEILKASYQIMKGHKGRLFYIELSFLPLFLLGLISCCLPFLWIYPYMEAVKANFYLDLMKKRSAVKKEEPTNNNQTIQ